jgi:hypothetical protein
MILVLLRHGGQIRTEDFPQRRIRAKAMYQLYGRKLAEPIYGAGGDAANIVGWRITEAGRERAKTLRDTSPHYADYAGKGQLERAAIGAALARARGE